MIFSPFSAVLWVDSEINAEIFSEKNFRQSSALAHFLSDLSVT